MTPVIFANEPKVLQQLDFGLTVVSEFFRGPDLSAHWPLGTLIGPRAWSLVGVVLCEGLRARTIRVPNASLSVFERDEGMPSTPRAMDKAVPSGAHKSRKMCMAQDRRRLRRTKRDHRPDVSCAIFCFLNPQFTQSYVDKQTNIDRTLPPLPAPTSRSATTRSTREDPAFGRSGIRKRQMLVLGQNTRSVV